MRDGMTEREREGGERETERRRESKSIYVTGYVKSMFCIFLCPEPQNQSRDGPRCERCRQR